MATVRTPRAFAAATTERVAWHARPGLDVARTLHVDPSSGLTKDEAARRLAELGPNALADAPPEPRWHAFARSYRDPMQLVLVAAAAGSLAIGELANGLVVLIVTVVNALLRRESEPTAPRPELAVAARVRRDGARLELAPEEVVVGDIVVVEAGDVVPADGRVLESATLELDESALTGERVPVPKGIEAIDDPGAPLADRTDMAYLGTKVTRGSAELVVTATGIATELGRVARLVETARAKETPLSRGLAALIAGILPIAGAGIACSIGLAVARGQDAEAVAALAVAFAIAALPTALPAVLTAILARGPRAADTLGFVSAVACDATGTLTLDRLTAVEMALPGRRHPIAGGVVKHVAGEPSGPLEPFLLPLALTTDAVVGAGDPVERALVELVETGGLDVAGTREALPRIAELPYDAEYKLAATFHRVVDERGAGVVRCFVRGAPARVLSRATTVVGPDMATVRADADFRELYLAEIARLARRGLRVTATARCDLVPDGFDPQADLLPLVDRLTLLMLVAVDDPLRPEATGAIERARDAGIEVRLTTAARAAVAETIGRRTGVDVVPRAAPEDKLRLVETLRAGGHVVAMAGGRVGDAPALRAADVGIVTRVGDGFSTIVDAVEAGRDILERLVASLRFHAALLAGMVLTFLGASVLDIAGGLAFLPLQTLYLSFTTQALQSVAIASGPPEAGLMERPPRPADEPLVARSSIALAGLIHAVVTLAVMALAEHEYGTGTARTMGLVTFALTSVLFSLLSARRDRTFLIATAASLVAIVVGAETQLLQRMIETTSLDFDQSLICLGAAISSALVLALSAWRRVSPRAAPSARRP